SRREYPGGLWEWHRCHVQYRGRRHTVASRGDFIRRYELDDFLLRRSGATVVDGHAVQSLERGDGAGIVDGAYAARFLVGAGGTTWRGAGGRSPPRPARRAAAQGRDFPADAAEVAATRVGADGEPELLLHDDLGGYSWNVPKGGWLNVGTGTAAAREVLAAWADARGFFVASGHVPASARGALEHMEGHSYYL